MPTFFQKGGHALIIVGTSYKLAPAGVGKKTGRSLSLDVFTVDKSTVGTVENLEKTIRENLERIGFTLPWDNTNQRLGRVGPGVPFTRLSQKLRNLFQWNSKGMLEKIPHTH